MLQLTLISIASDPARESWRWIEHDEKYSYLLRRNRKSVRVCQLERSQALLDVVSRAQANRLLSPGCWNDGCQKRSHGGRKMVDRGAWAGVRLWLLGQHRGRLFVLDGRVQPWRQYLHFRLQSRCLHGSRTLWTTAHVRATYSGK